MLSTSPKNNRAFRTPRRIVESDLRSLKRDRDYSNSLTLTNENRTLPELNLCEPYPSSKREMACFHAGRKILAHGRPLKADHPRTICFLYSVYMQWVLLVPSARIFLCWTILAPCYEDPGTRDKSDKNGGGSFTSSSRQWRPTISFGVTTNWLLW